MARVIQLSEHLSNMIAAGEVVLGPLNVVKELVENSLDAHATKIEIFLEEAGTMLIEVTDNGIGMVEEDALMSFNRHATSKIKNEGDLFRISSLGFRGEALPSIAAVSQMTMITKTVDTDGVKIEYQAGKLLDCCSHPSNVGTRIIVKKLFYNTPARLKYLKSPVSILSQISDLIIKMSLAHSDVSFKLVNDKHVIFQSRGNGDMIGLLANIYGVEIAKSMILRKNEVDGFNIDLYMAKPQFTKARKNDISVIVNGRIVKSNLINKAVIDACHTYMPSNRYPICLIDLHIDPLLIDVNVHPTKMEIKFSMDDVIYNLVNNNVLLALSSEVLIPKDTFVTSIREGSYQETILEMITDDSKIEETVDTTSTNEENYQECVSSIVEEKFIDDMYLNNQTVEKTLLSEENIEYAEAKKMLPYMEYIGSLFGTYLLFQNNDGLFLIDQHAAQERIKYEYYKKQFANPQSDTIELLLPFNFEVNVSEAIVLENNIGVLENLGVGLDQVGPKSFLIRKIPTWIKSSEPEKLIESVLNFLLEKKNFDIGKYRDSLAKMVSCKASIKANHFITKEDASSLFRELQQCNNPYTCPHGRPSIVKLSQYEIEKMFKRVM